MIELYQNEYVAEFLIYTHLKWNGKKESEKKNIQISHLFIFTVES